ncbi:MAG: 4-hydroxy-tetrahydrodipicolinate reductase [Elusimicrobia bacterium]|nr:4-hydroxy-tetrahydrodipicolinate reductase [Elusimicrobiota bacterium]
MSKTLCLIVCGAEGRMGRRVVALAQTDPRFRVAAGVVRGGRPASMFPFPLVGEGELPSYLPHADILVDFSIPAAGLRFARTAARHRKPIIVGTTGWTSRQDASLRALSRRTPVFYSPNFSLAVNVLLQIAQEAAKRLPHYDLGITEVHHVLKKDAPSGTALRLAELLRPYSPKPKIPIRSHRLGTIAGEHTLTLAGPFESLELTHRAESRDVFARGALETAWWLRGRRPGFYGMEHFLRTAPSGSEEKRSPS